MNLVASGHRRAAIALANARTPTTSSAWIELLCSLHAHLFREALPDHAGRLRITPVAYGHGHHERPGTDPEHIDLSLRQCFEDLIQSSVTGAVKDVDGFAKWGALFLERFFDIHPFDDGNGRVARLVLSHTAMSTVQHGLRQDLNYRSKKRYRNALEYAHLYRDGIERHDFWWIPLAKWLKSRLVPMIDAEPSTPPPASEILPDG